jgi:NADH dehydrogenase
VFGLPDSLAYLQAWSMEFAPIEMLSRDNLDSTKVDNVMTGSVSADLRITPAAMEAVVPAYLSGKSPKERYMHLRDHARR